MVNIRIPCQRHRAEAARIFGLNEGRVEEQALTRPLAVAAQREFGAWCFGDSPAAQRVTYRASISRTSTKQTKPKTRIAASSV
jgi:hypothetical protein